MSAEAQIKLNGLCLLNDLNHFALKKFRFHLHGFWRGIQQFLN